MNSFLLFFQKYGLLFILLNCWDLLQPDLSPKTALTDLDLGAASTSRSGSNLFKQFSWVMPLLLYIISFAREDFDFRISKSRFFIIFGFLSLILTILVSLIWSDFPSLTLKRVVFQTFFIVSIACGVFCAIKHDSLVRCINLLFYIALCTCVLSFLMGNGFQGGGVSAWANSKNNFGAYILSLISLFCISRYYYQEEVSGYWIKLSVLFFLLIASTSKTSVVVGMLLLTSSVIPYVLSKVLFFSLTVVLSFLFLFLPLISSLLGNYWDISYIMEPETLTGRGIIWDSLYYGVSDYGNLLLGHGYGAYFGTGVIPYALDDTWSYIRFLNSAHNGYLELLLQLGSILSLFVMFILYKLVCYTENPICFLVASIILIHNITESSVVRDQHVIWSLLVLLICIGSFMREKEMVEAVMKSRS